MKIENRILWTILGIGAGHFIGRSIGETEEEKHAFAQKGRWIGGLVVFGGTFAFEKANDTINYTLKHNGKRVYDGITKEYRLDTRLAEHQADGKIFNEVIFDTPRATTDARKLEAYRIKRFKPKYNIQHNC